MYDLELMRLIITNRTLEVEYQPIVKLRHEKLLEHGSKEFEPWHNDELAKQELRGLDRGSITRFEYTKYLRWDPVHL